MTLQFGKTIATLASGHREKFQSFQASDSIRDPHDFFYMIGRMI